MAQVLNAVNGTGQRSAARYRASQPLASLFVAVVLVASALCVLMTLGGR